MDGLDLQRLIAALLMPLPLSLMLAGAGLALLAGETRGRLHRGSDRAWEAAQLWHAGCAPWVVVSAGGGGLPGVSCLSRPGVLGAQRPGAGGDGAGGQGVPGLRGAGEVAGVMAWAR